MTIAASQGVFGDPSRTNTADAFTHALQFLAFIILPTLILVGLPPAAGAFVSWRTPPVGWGCRSLGFVAYAACQVVVTTLFLINYYEPRWLADRAKSYTRAAPQWLKTSFVATKKVVFYVLYAIFIFLSLFTSLGSTVMHLVGIYENCVCYVNAESWMNLGNAHLNVATDTGNQRASSRNWMTMGVTATMFIAICSYFGWWYQKVILVRYEEGIKCLLRTY